MGSGCCCPEDEEAVPLDGRAVYRNNGNNSANVAPSPPRGQPQARGQVPGGVLEFRRCPGCNQRFTFSQYDAHRQECGRSRPTVTKQESAGTPERPMPCPVCGLVLDPALLEGHRESCRSTHRKEMAEREKKEKEGPAATPALPTHEDPNEGSDKTCIICMDAPPFFAFLPCGHISCCKDCSMRVDNCPVCRGPREQLLVVNLAAAAQCRCKHCKHIICPTMFDSHREVCALQRRQREAAAAAAAQNVDEELQRRGSSTIAESLDLCVKCKVAQRSVAFLPCGHFLYCAHCAEGCSVCPLCLQTVDKATPIFG
jgi:hypothetical protein